jgi:TPR repeat protein
MRISDALIAAAVAGAAAMLGPATWALDGTRTPADEMSVLEAFRVGALALKQGEKAKALTSLQYAAENGHPLAQWKLGQMYAKGDGVPRNDLRAFEYYSRIANSANTQVDDRPDSPRARIISSALVALGHYYLDGIPNSTIRRDPARAWEMFHYAATYFADSDAQYDLARLYLDGVGAPKDPRQAVRWLSLAANKGQYQAQAMLGAILFKGEHVRRQASRGLMWLILARDAAARPNDKWIVELYDSAIKQATDDERAVAYIYLQRWMEHRRD